MNRILILNGPNLNLLGVREPSIYGNQTLDQLQYFLFENIKDEDQLFFKQSNSEGELINILHDSIGNYDGIIFNPAGYTHTSVSIYDAIKAINVPVVEVHISNIHSRESFRHNLVTTGACIGQISGFGLYSYILGYQALYNFLNNKRK